MRCTVRVIFCLFSISTLIAAQIERAVAEQVHLASDLYTQGTTSTKGTSGVDSAVEFFTQSREACEAGDVGTALRLATQTVVVDSDHADARRVLGYRRIGEFWAGSYAARRLERGEIWHPKFGWIKKEDLTRYQAGKRPFGKRWITIEEDARRHATIDNGWRIRTDHFRVTTNHSRQEASRLAARLETLHQIWQQLFGRFALKPTELLKRFDGKATSGYRSKPFEVVYYRTRNEYNAALRRQQPRIEMTLGIYFDTTRTTHFFAGGYDNENDNGNGQDAGTIYHEAVHQFFQESRPSTRHVGDSSNAWLIEGVACYFESLVEHPGLDERDRRFTIGTATAGRLPAARHRLLVDGFYVPLAELSALGIKDFQQRNDLPRLYSQSAGLVTFLMHYQDGVYRPALVETLQRLYAGRDRMSTLEDLAGRSFAELDREYREFIEGLPTAEAPLRTPTKAPLVP
ncbi:MAG: M1 family metallopeptidase [Planctomycetes bacterium]|nr:M1 family metallopeptidase [Planctomycetota bacterium]